MQKEYSNLAGLSAAERVLMDRWAAEESVSVSADDVAQLRGVSRAAASRILARLEAKGWLQRLQRGLYAPIRLGARTRTPVVDDAWVLAMRLFDPCFISGWSAAEHWDLTEQIFNSVAVVSASPQRRAQQTVAGVKYVVRCIPKKRMFGMRQHWMGAHQVSIADPSRMHIDILDSLKLGGGARHSVDVVLAYWRSKHADPDTLMEYALRYSRGTVFKRMGYLAELSGAVPDAWLSKCREHITKGVSDLDPGGPKCGRIITRWNLRVNVPIGVDRE